jgi:hypothetical protein
MAEKFAKSSLPPKLSFTGQLTPEQQSSVLQNAGIPVAPPNNQPHEIEQESRVYTPVSEVVTKTKRRL